MTQVLDMMVGVDYNFHVFDGNETHEGTVTLPANASDALIRQAVGEVSGVNLTNLMLDRYDSNLTFRRQAVFG